MLELCATPITNPPVTACEAVGPDLEHRRLAQSPGDPTPRMSRSSWNFGEGKTRRLNDTLSGCDHPLQ